MKLVAVVVVIVVVNYLSAVQVHGKLLGVGPRDERRACSAACRAWLIKRYDIDNFILMPIFKCSCDALFLLLSSAAPLCSLLRGFAQNLSPQSNLQSPAQSHPKFALLLGNLLMGTYVTCLTACFGLVSCAFGQTDSCQLSVTFIACTLFWVYFALLQPNVSDSVLPSHPALGCLCLSGSLSDLCRLQAVVVIAFLVSSWLQLKPSAVFNCHCHFGLFGLGNATFGHLQAKCLTKHNLQITQCGSEA